MWPYAIAAGAASGLGIVLVIRGLVPGPANLTAITARLDGSDRPTVGTLRDTEAWGRSQRVGSWAQRHLPAVFTAVLRPSDADLELIDKSRTTLMGEKVLAAFAGLLSPTVLGLLPMAFGASTSLALPAVVAIVAAVGLWFVPDMQARKAAGVARAQFARAVSIYLELLAIERTSGAAAAQAAAGAAAVARSWPFVRMTTTLERGRLNGLSAWAALRELGEEIQVPDLVDVAEILAQAGAQGASIFDQLQGKARTMRESQLAIEVQLAHSASARMWIFVPLTAVIYFALLIFPATTSVLFGP